MQALKLTLGQTTTIEFSKATQKVSDRIMYEIPRHWLIENRRIGFLRLIPMGGSVVFIMKASSDRKGAEQSTADPSSDGQVYRWVEHPAVRERFHNAVPRRQV